MKIRSTQNIGDEFKMTDQSKNYKPASRNVIAKTKVKKPDNMKLQNHDLVNFYKIWPGNKASPESEQCKRYIANGIVSLRNK